MGKKRIILSIASFFAQFTICMVNFAMVYYMKYRFGLSAGVIGIASSIYTVTYFISAMSFSNLFTNMNKKLMLAVAMFGMAFCNLFILLTSHVAVLYVLLGLYGVAMSFLWPNIEAWITENEEGNELSKSVSSFNFSWSFGAGLSTMVGGFLVEAGIKVPIIAGIFIFILVFLLFIPLKISKNVKAKEQEELLADHSTSLRYLSWTGIFISYACYSLMINIFPLYSTEVLGFSESDAGTLLLFRGMTSCFSFILFSKLDFWQFKKSVILASQLILALLFIAFSFMQEKITIAVFFVAYGIVFALVYEMSIFHGASGAAHREKRMVVHEVLINIGMVLGSSLGGVIYERFSFSATLYVLSAIAFLSLGLESLLYNIRFGSKQA